MARNKALDFPEMFLNEENYKQNVIPILKEIRPEWEKEEIQFKSYTTGKLNILMGVSVPDDPSDILIFRMFPEIMDPFINKNLELKHMKMLNNVGLGPKILAFFKNGFCYEYAYGESLTWKTMGLDPAWRLVAKAFAQLHTKVKSEGKEEGTFFKAVKDLVDRFPEELPTPELNKRLKEVFPPKEQIEQERLYLESQLKPLNSPVVFCHNDSVPENIIWNKKNNTVILIDFEFATFNFQAYDLGCHFCEFAGLDDFDASRYPTENFQLQWLRTYLEEYHQLNNLGKVTDADVRKLYVQANKFAAASHFLNGVLCIVLGQSGVNPDYHFLYGFKRWEAYSETKDKLMNLKE